MALFTDLFGLNKPKKKSRPDEPERDVPKINRAECPSGGREHRDAFIKIIKQLSYRHRIWKVWNDFIVMFACAISNSVDKTNYDEREELYLKTIRNYTNEDQSLFPKLVAETVMALDMNMEQDFLGSIYMELGLGNNAVGQVFTPYDVCRLMAQVTTTSVCSQVRDKGYVTINDCTCGAGATLIAGIHEVRKQLTHMNLNFQNHVLVAAQDIDYTTALMCYIQLSLLGVAAYVKVGNSLTEPMRSSDTLENYWFTPMYFSDVWKMRRLFHGKEFL